MADQEYKKNLRRQVRAKIAGLSEEYIASSDAGIYSVLTSLPEFVRAPKVFAYFSVGREVDTHKIIELSFELGKAVALPISMADGIMEFAEIEPGGAAMAAGMLRIPQPADDARRLKPESDDLILVPALCYDKDNYRLGQGGGYYDRFLSTCPAFSLGLCRSELLMDMVPREVHDLPSQCLITERGKVKQYR